MRKIFCICILFLTACAATTQSHLDKIQSNFTDGNFTSATTASDIKTMNNLDLLITAMALFHENKFCESDDAFEEFNKRNINETATSVSRETTALLFGGGVNSYKPYMLDSLFVSYYQIWDLLALSDWSNARVVINQSYERQKTMSQEYEKLVEQNKSKLSHAIELKNELDKNKTDWAAFSDIMNAALMYLSGIYFLNDGDFATAETYLKRANGMAPENAAIKSDLKNAQNHIRPTNTTWIFTESGFAPRLKEENFGLFLPSIGMVYFNISTPQFLPTKHTPTVSELLDDVDKMFMTEFNEYRTNEILRTYASTVAKSALQSTMYNSGSKSAPFMGILSTIYTISSSNSDVRTWATLPKYISVKRIASSDLHDAEITGNNLIYIREHDKTTDKKIIKLK